MDPANAAAASNCSTSRVHLEAGRVIRHRWTVVQKLGEGGFGDIYRVSDKELKEDAAMKIEKGDNGEVLKMEVHVLNRLKGKRHVCQMYGSGREPTFTYVVMSLCGTNLSDLRRKDPHQKFSLATSLRLGLQVLESLEDLHEVGFLHRDVKPSNFAMGNKEENKRTVFMLDFGLARQFVKDGTDVMRKPRTKAGFRGTIRYASINCHENQEMGRHDDIWSLVYMLIEFIRGQLPWRKANSKSECYRMKQIFRPTQLVEKLPQPLTTFVEHLTLLTYYDKPHYAFLKDCLTTALNTLHADINGSFEWEVSQVRNIFGGEMDVVEMVVELVLPAKKPPMNQL